MDLKLLHHLDLDNFISLDVETTGLDKNKDKIIEVSAIKYKDGIENATFSYLINPQKKIPLFIENLTGITNSSVIDKPIFQDISNKFIQFIGDMPLIGHNIGFDIDFINKELNIIDVKLTNLYICDTYILSRIFYYYLDSFKLESICAKLNISTGLSHRALDDSRSAGSLFLKLVDKMIMCDINTVNMLIKCIEKHIVYNNILLEKIIKLKINKNINKTDELEHQNNFYIYNKKSKGTKRLTVSDILGKDSILVQNNTKYQYRENQLAFSEESLKTIINNDILIAEAGTGLGKSFGYLVPSILNIDDENIIISTSTHNLQNQLLHKDIPHISEYLNKNIKAIVLKGQNNYLCYDNLDRLVNSKDDIFDTNDINELMSIIYWSNNTLTGDITECASFDIKRNKKLWDLLRFNKDTCYTHSSNQKNKCFYTETIKDSKDSNVFIVNHALLARNVDNQELLFKKESICIIDEAHRFIENSRSQLSNSISYFDLKKDYDYTIKLISAIIKENSLSTNIQDCFNVYKKEGIDLIEKFNSLSVEFANSKIIYEKIPNGNCVIDCRYLSFTQEKNFNLSVLELIVELFKKQIDGLSEIKKQLELLLDDKFNNQKKQIANIQNRYYKYHKIISEELFNDSPDYIRWIKVYLKDRKIKHCIFNSAPFSINKTINKICSNFNSLIFCSATLSIDGDFSYFIDDVGLDNCVFDKEIKFKNFPSPFYYNDQIKMFLYNTNEDVNSNTYISKISGLILDLKSKIHKRMLILCTSYKQINDFKKIFEKDNFQNIYYQSITSSKENLLKQYITNDNAVLFGTSSFWEGIDLPNELLEILIIVKIPFDNPHNPIVGAKIDFYNQIGRNAFYEYQIPKTILKLKQGIGRLIRTDEDSGICILTDSRLISKKYGNEILESLPTEAIITNSNSIIINKTENFLNL